MIIESSNLDLKSSRSYWEVFTQQETLRVWNASPAEETDGQDLADMAGDTVLISDHARQAEETRLEFKLSPRDELKITAFTRLLEAFTGKKIQVYLPKVLKASDSNIFKQSVLELKSSARAGWGLEFNRSETYSEQEFTSFQASGIVKTADGREVNISLQLNMSRSFTSRAETHIRAGDARLSDPLVINFNAPAAALTDRNFQFDLDCDGSTETISFLRPGSGFLALDLNQDGIINNGRELFGPQQGDGFAELAQYDADHNGWIDENDPIWDQLRIWSKDSAGNDELLALGAKGLGAICLQPAETSFALKDAGNRLNGSVRSTSIFLNENGSTGTLQQIDLTI